MISLEKKRKIVSVLLLILMKLQLNQKHRRFISNEFASYWIEDIINSLNPNLCKDAIGMSSECFYSFLAYIEQHVDFNNIHFTRVLNMNVKLFIGFQWLIKGEGIRTQSVQWRLSYESIKNCRDTTMNILLQIYPNLVNWDLVDDLYSDRISNNGLYEVFGGVVGCMDGTHIPCIVRENMAKRFRNRYNYTSTNVLAVCNFNMLFLYSIAGCEGLLLLL